MVTFCRVSRKLRMNRGEHFQNLLQRLRREFRKKYCLHPDAPRGCSKRIASAHTIQRAMLAKHIVIDGHVVKFKVEPMLGPPPGLFVSPDRIGLNEATTFFGFCDKHDSELFRE